MKNSQYQTISVKDDDNFAFLKKLTTAQAMHLDRELCETISDDISTIWRELGGQDGVCAHVKPLTRVYRDRNFVRVYSLMNLGGVAIICSRSKYIDENIFQIITLGEDDQSYFPYGRRVYEEFYGTKEDFVACLAEAISLFNNIKL